jgi:tRNA (uracil-5-)-methyltransferase
MEWGGDNVQAEEEEKGGEEEGGEDGVRKLYYTQAEGSFSQPNAGVCELMLSWACDVAHSLAASPSRPSSEASGSVGGDCGAGGKGGKVTELADAVGSDLCELYCGNGCFTVALAPHFRRVVATELSKASVELAKRNVVANGLSDRVHVARLSAQEFCQLVDGSREFSRLKGSGIAEYVAEASSSNLLQTLFVDPPRSGLDETCVNLAKGFENVIYVSCNPHTLARDVAELNETHRVIRLAAFDQFPYTPHLEAGVLLQRRN